MTIWIGDPSLSKAVGLIRDWKDLAPAGGSHPLCSGIGVVGNKAQPNSRPLQRSRAEIESLWVLVDDEEPQLINGHLGYDVSRWRGVAGLLDRAKCMAVELNRRNRILNSEHRC